MRRPRRDPPTAAPKSAELESYTVTYDRERQPVNAILTALDAEGRRHWATSRHAEVIDSLLSADRIEATARFAGVAGERPEVVAID